MKTKEEISNAILSSYCSVNLKHISDAVLALDVCTLAERHLVEWLVTGSDIKQLLAKHGRTAALENIRAVLAERTPSDPVETFITDVRKTCDDWGNGSSVHSVLTSLLTKLDAARTKK